jgi:hypothetical protein
VVGNAVLSPVVDGAEHGAEALHYLVHCRHGERWGLLDGLFQKRRMMKP